MFENYFKKAISLEEGEEIKTIIHHHPLTFAGQFLKIFIIPAVLTIFIFIFGFYFLESILNNSILSTITLVALIVWGTYAFYHWYIWYFDAYVITNEKVIITEQTKIFEKKIITASFSKVQDISVDFKGLLQTIFKYGTVHIQTAGEDTDLKLHGVGNPQDVARVILNIRDENSGIDEEETNPQNKKIENN